MINYKNTRNGLILLDYLDSLPNGKKKYKKANNLLRRYFESINQIKRIDNPETIYICVNSVYESFVGYVEHCFDDVNIQQRIKGIMRLKKSEIL